MKKTTGINWTEQEMRQAEALSEIKEEAWAQVSILCLHDEAKGLHYDALLRDLEDEYCPTSVWQDILGKLRTENSA